MAAMQLLSIVLVLLPETLLGSVVHMQQHINRDVPSCTIRPFGERFDCLPGSGIAIQADCEKKGCCWDPQSTNHQTGIPWCYYPTASAGYTLTNIHQTDYGFSGFLERSTSSGWPDDVMKLKIDVWLETQTRVHFKITDPVSARYEVPITTPVVTKKSPETDYDIHFTESPFGIKIARKSTGAVIFESSIPQAPLVYADQFLQISTKTATGMVYGLGEHMTPLLLNSTWKQVAMWNRDTGPQFGANLYGTHPFYLGLETDGKAHGVFLLNSNAMDVDIQPLPALTFRTIGGVLDFYVFLGPTGDNVVQQYTQVVGRPYMPPYWALGFHLCRWGYNSSWGLKEIIDRNRALDIPYEVQWNDIDYMDAFKDWTFNKNQFQELPQIVDDLHNHTQKYVIIVDPAISASYAGSYPPYDQGIQDGIFIINNQTNKPLIGMVWPGETVFPDFTHPKSFDWWYRQARDFHKALSFDGLWIDMNDPSNAVYGSVDGCSNTNKYDNPPYVPGLVQGSKLPSRTICPSARQYLSSHYNLHNLYGLQEAEATYKALVKVLNKRSIVISRSSYPSQGQYGGHWTGDIQSTWEHMHYTIPALLKFNMFGIPLVGSDVCGFNGDTTEELCIRWTQLGAFYPFMRNHNGLGFKAQDPGAFSKTAQAIMKTALQMRYLLLPHLYTLFYHSHIEGTTVARPLSFNFPDDQTTYSIDRQFMWGDSLLISPVLDQGRTRLMAYLPKAEWYNFNDGTPTTVKGRWMNLAAPLDTINVHVRGGSVVPLQNVSVTTVLARKNPFFLVVALDDQDTASGDLYWDDGETLDSISQGQYNLINFKAKKGQLSSTPRTALYNVPMKLTQIDVWGVRSRPSTVSINGQKTNFTYIDQLKILHIYCEEDLKSTLSVTW